MVLVVLGLFKIRCAYLGRLIHPLMVQRADLILVVVNFPGFVAFPGCIPKNDDKFRAVTFLLLAVSETSSSIDSSFLEG